MTEKLRVAALLSGSGTTLQNLIDRAASGELPIEIVKVISSRSDAYGLERATRAGIDTSVLRRKDYESTQQYSDAVWSAITPSEARLVVLAGFMVKIFVPESFKNRVINVHPALLPDFGGQGMYGHFVHEAVLAQGCRKSGATVHFVNNEYDSGPIICQQTVEVSPADTPDSLAEKVQAAEREIYPQAIKYFAEGRLSVNGNDVRIAPAEVSG
jgi:phosphoribosylglycinamide formyltransferase 1